ncbi:MAG: phage holin family protein [Opitutaceae bacterium]|nr:phage holin family protein [Opitutaceae bacterium]
MTEPPRPTAKGFVAALRALGDGIFASCQHRLGLLSAELQEEKLRLIQTFIWISAAVFTGMMAMAFASLTVVYLFWESARLWVLGGLTIVYAASLVAIILAFRAYLLRQPSPFAATLHEIGEDRACIHTKN